MTLKYLYILRHAKSDWSKSVTDFDRPINQRGEQAARKMAFWLAEQEIQPQLIISSPALRARQTVEILCQQTGRNPEIILWDERIYEADYSDLLQVIGDNADRGDSLLIAGHNPGLDNLVKHLSYEMPPYSKTGKLMTTAAIALITFDEGYSDKAGSGHIAGIARPKEI